MPRVLVLYGTTEGHTGRIAEVLARVMRAQGAKVDVANAALRNPTPEPYTAVVVAASVHAAGYQPSVSRWVRMHADALRHRQTAFVSVCLGVLQHSPDVDRELETIKERFLSTTGWRPTVTKVVAGALPYSKYNWLKRWVMQRIVRKAGGDTDTSCDYEYTDWEDLRRFGLKFVGGLHSAPLAQQPDSTCRRCASNCRGESSWDFDDAGEGSAAAGSHFQAFQ